MKRIIAFFKTRKLPEVTLALREIEGLSGASVSEVQGFGRGRALNQPDNIIIDAVYYMPGTRLEVICADELLEEVVKVIESTAHTGLRGDGKIYISNVEDAMRISTGERGKDAV
jgi:nitrogen regulatory protein P-II 1